MALLNLLISILLAAVLCEGLSIPHHSGFWSANRNDSDWALPFSKPWDIANNDLNNSTIVINDAWPPLPINLALGYGVEITFTQLGPVTAPSQRDEIIVDMACIELAISKEQDPLASVPKAYRRSVGGVLAFFGTKPNAGLKGWEAAEIVRTVKAYFFTHAPREILVAEIRINDRPAASFALLFDGLRN